MSFLGHNTNKSEHSAAFIPILVPGAGRNIGIRSGLYRGVFALDMQGAMTLKYIIDVGPIVGMPGAVSALRQLDYPHDISIPALSG
jgi:hypothetical protein